MDPVTASALAAVGGELIGGLIDSNSAKSANKAAAHENEEAFKRTLYMSNTAHEREVIDLKNAGLNPILSAHGGASAYNIAAPPVQSERAGLARSVASASSRAMEMELNKSAINVQNTQARLNNANAAKSAAETSQLSGGKFSIPGIYSGPFSSAWSAVNRVGGWPFRVLGRKTANIKFKPDWVKG